MTRREYRDYEAAVAAFCETEGIKHLSTLTSGRMTCEECGGKLDTDDHDEPYCEKCDHEYPHGDTYYSRNPCDCCKRWQDGDRLDASYYSDRDKEVRECVICPDCEYYAEHGRLDDATMDGLDDSPEEG